MQQFDGRPGSRTNAPGGGRAAARASSAIGNRALARLVRAADLKPLTGFTLGSSTFGAIHKALAAYEKSGRLKDLQKVEEESMAWLNKHKRSSDKNDVARRPLVEELLDQVNAERVKQSRAEAQDIYLSNVRGGESEFDLKAISGESRSWAGELNYKKAKALRDAKGLTQAEVSAIQTFTAADYKYINPATANSASWMAGQKKGEWFSGVDDKTLHEEGSLIAGVAMQALLKLDPYDGLLYRGTSFTKDEFEKNAKSRKSITFNAFTSASVDKEVAEHFAKTTGKPFAVIYEFHDTGGRDVSDFSLNSAEKEVVLLPGSTYVVESFTEMAAPAGGEAQTWYLAKLGPPGG